MLTIKVNNNLVEKIEFKDLWLPPSRCRGKAREVCHWQMFLASPRINSNEAAFTIDGICDGIFRLFGKNIPKHLCGRRVSKSVALMTEEVFAVQMRHLYICMNRARPWGRTPWTKLR